jgi:hypothetical protein
MLKLAMSRPQFKTERERRKEAAEALRKWTDGSYIANRGIDRAGDIR